MPIGKETISESKENAQYKPGESRHPQRNEIPLPKWREYPAKKIKKNQCDMKSKKENIGNVIPVDHVHIRFGLVTNIRIMDAFILRSRNVNFLCRIQS